MEQDSLNVLENRIADLEDKVFGNEKIVETKKPLADCLVDVNNQMTTALAQRDSVNAIMKRLDQLEDYLDPTFGDQVGLSSAAKLEMVTALEPEMRQRLTSLDWFNKNQNCLNSDQIRDVPALQGKLDKLTLIYLDNKQKAEAQTAKVHHLLEQYNDLVTTLSSSFVQWDQVVTDSEIAAQPKKRLN